MKTENKKKEENKNDFFLTFGMVSPLNFDYNDCPLDNNLIKDQYISDKGMFDWVTLSKTSIRNYKCFSLHSVVNGKDITDYDYGDIGYDLDPSSMKVYLGGWGDLLTSEKANNLANDEGALSRGKINCVYLDKNGCVHNKMNTKVLQRSKLLLEATEKVNIEEPDKIEKYIFNNTDKTLDNSFDNKTYCVKKENDKLVIEERTEKNAWLNEMYRNFRELFGFFPNIPFTLSYDIKTKQLFIHSGELNGVAKIPEKGIKVDRIFIREERLEQLKGIQRKEKKSIYDNYIKKLTEVLIKQFPFGEIRVIKGQDFNFLKPEEFIKKYFINEEEKKKYLDKLENIKKSKTGTTNSNCKQYKEKDVKNKENYNLKDKDYKKKQNNI